MNEFDPTAYRITIVKKDMEGNRFFVGTVSEFPHVKVYEESWTDAYQSIVGMIADFYDQACADGEPFPEPAQEAPAYSGRVTVRIPKWLHQRLDEQATEQDVSLNFHISTLLTEGSNWVQKGVPEVRVGRAEKMVVANFKHIKTVILDVPMNGEGFFVQDAIEQYVIPEPSNTNKVSYGYEQQLH